MGRLQIDHVQPIAKGGLDNDDNLCLACELCNQHKWTQTHGIDPDTGQYIALFHPRRQRWSDNFVWGSGGAEIVGVTACGRATIRALRLNDRLAVTVRRNWIRADWHPPGEGGQTSEDGEDA